MSMSLSKDLSKTIHQLQYVN